MSEMQQTEIVIVGGGMVGLVLALALAEKNFQLILLEPQMPLLDWPQDQPVARVSAINAVAQRILRKLNVWPLLHDNSYASLQRLVVWDGIGAGKIEFDSADIGVTELGSIIENRELIKQAWLRLSQYSHVEIGHSAPVACERSDNFIKLILADGKKIQAQLCVGADGANSWVREQMQAQLNQRSYQQQALIAVVETEAQHQYTGWQVFLPTGPLALLPLKDVHRCAIVWSATSERAQALMQLSNEDFAIELNNAFGLQLGEIKCCSPRQSFPLTMRHVTHYSEPHIALVGDAAHTLHPLAGQGVNLGLLDAACLVDCLVMARQKKQNLGSLKPLRRYERWRKGVNTEMMVAMRLLNDLFLSSNTFVIQARSQGFNWVDRLHHLKKYFIRQALGGQVDLPSLAQF